MKNKIIDLLCESGLSAYSKGFDECIKPSIRLFTSPIDENSLPLGTSKFGGKPDLPDGYDWPKWKDYVHSFIAQINLSELPEVAHAELPKKGILYFFYIHSLASLSDNDYWIEMPKFTKVYFYDGDFSLLNRRSFPKELEDINNDPFETTVIFRPCSISFCEEWTIATINSVYAESVGLSSDYLHPDWQKWCAFCDKFREQFCINVDDFDTNRMLGFADYLQSDIRDKEIVNLLQVDTDEEKTGMDWGLSGRLFFQINKGDLDVQNFDNVVGFTELT
jgi:uncharacterized protein YwqG